MAARQAFSRGLRSVAGATFLALGLVILLASLDSLTASMSNFDSLSPHEALGILPALGPARFLSAKPPHPDSACGWLPEVHRLSADVQGHRLIVLAS